MVILNMVWWWNGGGWYKSYTELKAMSLSDVINEINWDASWYFENLTWNLRMYNTYYIGNDDLSWAYSRNWWSIFYDNWQWKMEWEFVMVVMSSDSNWDLKIPIAWYNNSTSSQNAPYNWKISIDWWTQTTYSWTWSATAITVASWLTANSDHTIMITPTTESYWWARAFWFRSSWVTTLLKKVLRDGSYMWYSSSDTNTWTWFRMFQYNWCSNLTEIPEEEAFPTTVTTVGGYFRRWTYANCTSLVVAQKEIFSNTVTSVGDFFRDWEYSWCKNLTTVFDESFSSWVTSIWNYFRENQYKNCKKITKPLDESLPWNVTSIWTYFRSEQYSWCSEITYASEEKLPNTVTSIWQRFRNNQYSSCTKISQIKWWKNLSVWWNYYRYYQFNNCNTNKTVKVLSDVWYASYSDLTLANSYVTQVQVPSDYLSNFKNSTAYPRSQITDSKFVWY